MIAMVEGKRIVINKTAQTVTITGKAHIDQYPFSKAPARVSFYEKLHAKHSRIAGKQFYAPSLAAAKRAADMVAQAETASCPT